MRVRSSTRPRELPFATSPMRQRALAAGEAAQRRQPACHDGAGTMARKRPSQATYSGSSPSSSQAPCTSGRIGTAASSICISDPRRGGDLAQRRGQPAARRIAQDPGIGSDVQQGADERQDRRRVGAQRGLERDAVARHHHRDAVVADRTGDQQDVAGRRPLGTHVDAVANPADGRGVDVDPVALAPVDHLRVPGHHRSADRGARRRDRGDDAAQIGHGKPLFEDQADAETERLGTAHGDVVRGAVHGQRADVAAGKEGRLHDEGVGREGEALAADGEHGAVAQLVQRVAAEGRKENVFDELRHLAPAAAVRHLHHRIVLVRQRALEAAGHSLQAVHGLPSAAPRP